jgi:hypothetical protein
MFEPPLMINSFARPLSVNRPSSSIAPRSPVINHPSTSVARVLCSSPQYALITTGPRTATSPSPVEVRDPFASLIAISMPLLAIPTEASRRSKWGCQGSDNQFFGKAVMVQGASPWP